MKKKYIVTTLVLLSVALIISYCYFFILGNQSKHYSIRLLDKNQSTALYLEKLEVNGKVYMINRDIPKYSNTYNFDMSYPLLTFEDQKNINIIFTIKNKDDNKTINPSCSLTFDEKEDNCFIMANIEKDHVFCICDF